MKRVRRVRRMRERVLWIAAVAFIAMLALAGASHAAAVVREEAVSSDGPAEPRLVPDSEASQRVVVDPESHWGDWGDIDDSFYHYHPGGLRIDTWVDRGEWATYEPGERLWIYFRVNRPCYVTILDYTTDGRVETIYPNRWSGSALAQPGRTYRVPDDRRFSLRIAGPEGIETLVACAHELTWPRASSGWWVPQYHEWLAPRGRVMSGGSSHGWSTPGGKPHGQVVPGGKPRGQVVPGRKSQGQVVPGGKPHGQVVPGRKSQGQVVPGGKPRGQVVPGGSARGRVVVEGSSRWTSPDRSSSRHWGPPRGRVVVGPGWWPVPDGWRNSPGRWAYDSVTFRVDDGGYSNDWGSDWWHGGSGNDDWDDDWDDDYGYDGWDGHTYGRPLMHERFRMSNPRDSMHEDFKYDGEKVHVRIDCIADRKNDPTEILGRVGWFGGWGDDIIFHIDASGREGVVPRRGDVYSTFNGPVRVDVEITEVRMAHVRPWQLPRIEWIKFDVKAYGR